MRYLSSVKGFHIPNYNFKIKKIVWDLISDFTPPVEECGETEQINYDTT